MSLIRLIQESEVIKNGPIFSLKPYECEVENMKQIIKEKNVLITNHTEKIKELEHQVAELEAALEGRNDDPVFEEQKKKLEHYAQMCNIIKKYEKFIYEITASYAAMIDQRNAVNEDLTSLECSFADMYGKYQHLKSIVIGYKQNQDILIDHIETYKNALNFLQRKYSDFREYATIKIGEANAHNAKEDKKHLNDMAKVKSQVIQSKSKINELEKTISLMSANTNIGDVKLDNSNKISIFTPLSFPISD